MRARCLLLCCVFAVAAQAADREAKSVETKLAANAVDAGSVVDTDAGADAGAAAEAPAEEATSDAELAAGHSRHGEAFNEGPRQQAYLMPGTGEISFEVGSEVDGVQAFVEQGIGQLHGFWYFEAERSFRQAAMLDPECAIAYWGMSKANTNNEDRAKELIQKAYDLRNHASEREQRYIETHHAFLWGEGKKKEREADYVEAVEKLIEDYPDDLEAKALLGYLLYKYRGSADRTHAEVDVILDQVHAKSKNHPVHHYRIHLWDHKSPQRALDSAAQCGPAAPAIAHMWHMCGHIFSRVKRYGDAAWFQEASARVDHRHMMHDRVMPDQIHNFAHNNEWFIRNMMHVGRVQEALNLAKNMIELPRHPKYNTLERRNSAWYGRERLLNVLERFELWEQAMALGESEYLEPVEDRELEQKRLHLLVQANAYSGRLDAAAELIEQLRQQKQDLTEAGPEPIEEPGEDEDPLSDKERKKREKKQKEKHETELERAEEAVQSALGHLAMARGEHEQAREAFEAAEEDELTRARALQALGRHDEAVKLARDYQKSRKAQVQPLAALVEILWAADDKAAAREAMVQLRAHSQWLDANAHIFQRLTSIAVDLGFPEQWKVEQPSADDLGKQPSLASLGPFRWQPAPAPDWVLPNESGEMRSLQDYRGRPVVVVFYLGFGCLHCVEQLQALAPQADAFRAAGIELVAISSDSLRDLAISVKNYDEQAIPFPLVSDASMDVFRAYRCYDDFEDMPLHGTFLIDAEGKMRWQDISYEPFMEIDFLLEECQRLLGQTKPPLREGQELALGAAR